MKKLITIISLVVFAVQLNAQAPSWSVTPSAYQFTATVTGVVVEDGEYVNSTGDKVAAFVNGEVRGVATATAVSSDQFYFITIYSNVAAGEQVSFQFYDSNADSILNVLDSISFSSNATFGEPGEPYELKLNELESESLIFSGILDQDISPLQSFTPVPLNDFLTHAYSDPVTYSVETTDLIPVIKEDTLRLYVPFAGWNGSDEVIVTAQNDNRSSVMDIDTALFSVTVNGLNESIEAKSFTVYPNPVQSSVTVELKVDGSVEATLTNSSGVVMKTMCLNAQKNQVDMSDLPSGTYVLAIFNSEGVREYSLINHIE